MLAARDNGISSVLFRNAIGRKLKLSVTESECLSLLAIKQTATPTELAKYVALTTGATATMLNRLEKARLITRTPNPNDRRSVFVKISPAYFKVTRPLVMSIQQPQTELLATYSNKELEIIVDFLVRFTDNVTKETAIINRSITK